MQVEYLCDEVIRGKVCSEDSARSDLLPSPRATAPKSSLATRPAWSGCSTRLRPKGRLLSRVAARTFMSQVGVIREVGEPTYRNIHSSFPAPQAMPTRMSSLRFSGLSSHRCGWLDHRMLEEQQI